MKLRPRASSSDLEEARAIAQRLSRLGRSDGEEPHAAAPAGGTAASAYTAFHPLHAAEPAPTPRVVTPPLARREPEPPAHEPPAYEEPAPKPPAYAFEPPAYAYEPLAPEPPAYEPPTYDTVPPDVEIPLPPPELESPLDALPPSPSMEDLPPAPVEEHTQPEIAAESTDGLVGDFPPAEPAAAYEDPLAGLTAEPEPEPLPPPLPPANWFQLLNQCLFLSQAHSALLADASGGLLAAVGDWPVGRANTLASKLHSVIDKAEQSGQTPLTARLGGQVLTAWRFVAEGQKVAVGFLGDAPLAPEVAGGVESLLKR